MGNSRNDYTPGKGSYKVEEGGAIKGIGSSNNVDYQFGSLTFDRDDFSIKSRGLDLSLSSRFNSDHLYSTVIKQIAKGDQPSGTLMTLPGGQTNFYRIADGWSWDLPYVMIGQDNIFKVVIGGKTFDLSSVISYETWNDESDTKKIDLWVEGYHVKYSVVRGTSPYYRDLELAIPEVGIIITCTVKKENVDTDYKVVYDDTDPFKLYSADGTCMEFKETGVDGTGHIRKVTDASGLNSLEYSYETDSITGSITNQGTPKRSSFEIASTTGVKIGDLITVRNETKVIWGISGSVITISGGFNFEPVAGDAYNISKGQIKKIVHTDGRCVKFYYYIDPEESLLRMTTLLSSDTDELHLAEGDLFLNRYTFKSNRLTKVETLNTKAFTPTDNFDITDDSVYIEPLQKIVYGYDISADPSPETDYITITNHAGAVTKYLFQKGGFCSHSYNTVDVYQGRVRAKSSTSVLNIDEPDFLVTSDYYFGVSRYRVFNDSDSKKDNSAVWRYDGLSKKQKRKLSARGVENTIVDYKDCSIFSEVNSVPEGNRINLLTPLASAPYAGDQYLAIKNPDYVNRGVLKDTSPINTSKIFIDASNLAKDDYIAIRNEIRKISYVYNTTGTVDDYVLVESPFSFCPSYEGGQDQCIIKKKSDNNDFYVYYLNKPKVVKVEIKESETDPEWKSVSYKYTYLKGGNETTDDLGGGGFIDDDVDGEFDEKIIPDDIKLIRTSVITWKDGKDQSDFTQKVIDFNYNSDDGLMGQKTVKNYKKQDSEWIPVDMTVNIIGFPCTNAAYYGVTSYYNYKSTCSYTEASGIPDDQKWKKYVDLDYDGYGRVIRARTYSPSLAGGQSINEWMQYVGIGTGDNLDPYGEFENNPYAVDYQARYDSKHCFKVLGAKIVQVNKDGLRKKVFNNFNPLLNITITRNVVSSGLTEGDYFHTLDFRATYDENGTPTTETDINKIYHTTEHETERSNNWSTVRFSLPHNYGVKNLVTLFEYNSTTNNLVKITKPLSNEINLVYGDGWKASYVARDYTELDSNLGGTSQYIVNRYDYDIKGRLTVKKTNLSTDTEGTSDYDGTKYPQSMAEYEYDGMDRVIVKRAGSTSTNAVIKQVFDDDVLTVTATDYLAFRTITSYDRFFRPVKIDKYRPNRSTNIDYDNPVADTIRTGSSEYSYDIMAGKVSLNIQYSDNEEGDGKRIISKTEFDKLGRPVRSLYKNTDSVYDGNKVFQLKSVVEYIDAENAVVSKSYLGNDNNSYRQVKVVNDWLGRGVTEEYTWPGNNGTGEVRVVRNSYNHTGNLVLKEMPNGEKYGYIYNSEGQLEKSQYPDGKYSIVNYDNNGNVLKTKDRRGITVTNSYNKSDMLIKSESGDLEISTLYSHFGPASVTEKEDSAETLKNEYEFHFSGGVTKNTQTIDGSIIQILEGSFDDGGNQITTKATGSGTGVNEWSKELNIDSQYHSSNPDEDHFNKTAILDGTAVKILRESDYLGLQNKISYGTTAGSEVSYTYDNFLKLKSLISSEAALGMDITLTRDFTGNILTKENNTYTYDGMNRLLSGEGEDYRYDEISNLLVRGSKTYEYQSIGTDKNQMRLRSFSDGVDTYAYKYDSNGNTTIVSGRFTAISYDNLNRLREITHADTRVDRYSYNFSGLRFKKEEDVNGSNIVLYSLYRGNNPVIQEKYEGSTLVETRFNIISGGQVVAHMRKVYGVSENFEYFYLDNLGSRRVVLDESGAVTDKFTYSAYGEVTHVPSSNDYLASFTGKEYDSTGLIYFNARYYDPVVGRFLTEDPSRDGTNWYGYVNNNPINFIDPTGLREAEYGTKKEDTNPKKNDNDDKPEKNDDKDSIIDKALDFLKNMQQKRIQNILKRDYKFNINGLCNAVSLGMAYAIKAGIYDTEYIAAAIYSASSKLITTDDGIVSIIEENGYVNSLNELSRSFAQVFGTDKVAMFTSDYKGDMMNQEFVESNSDFGIKMVIDAKKSKTHMQYIEKDLSVYDPLGSGRIPWEGDVISYRIRGFKWE